MSSDTVAAAGTGVGAGVGVGVGVGDGVGDGEADDCGPAVGDAGVVV
jgi:hypothetical protein